MMIHEMTAKKIGDDLWNNCGRTLDRDAEVLVRFAELLESGAMKRWRRRPWTRPPWQSGRR